jgi:hypothetical protein
MSQVASADPTGGERNFRAGFDNLLSLSTAEDEKVTKPGMVKSLSSTSLFELRQLF